MIVAFKPGPNAPIDGGWPTEVQSPDADPIGLTWNREPLDQNEATYVDAAGQLYVLTRLRSGEIVGVADEPTCSYPKCACEGHHGDCPRLPDLAGVLWEGDGHEVRRDDEAKRFPGDMEAAVHVAQVTDCRWLLYVEDADRWAVIACSSENYASGEVDDCKKHQPGAEHFFYFDGRRGLDVLRDGPNGVGYRLKPGVIASRAMNS